MGLNELLYRLAMRWWLRRGINTQQYLQRWHNSGLRVATGNFMDSADKLDAAKQREAELTRQLTELDHPIITRRLR